MATLNRPPLRTITGFKSKLAGGGARPNLFEVELAFPDALNIDNDVKEKSRFLVKAASLPASNIAPIDINFRGRILKIAGDRTFDTWTITVMNDVDFAIRNAFELWMNQINKLSDNTGTTNPAEYQPDAFVHQLDRDGSTLRTYKFHDVFPTNISAQDLSYETTDTIEEFTVELQVQWWEAIKGVGANVGGDSIS
ncbi:MAG: phage tail protein [Candidatus Poseidoniia archaeon]|nr:phage tail protein [Candidatus Poseidoniia archaeon]